MFNMCTNVPYIIYTLFVILQEDKPWDWDRLFTEVTSELLSEWEINEKPEEDTA